MTVGRFAVASVVIGSCALALALGYADGRLRIALRALLRQYRHGRSRAQSRPAKP